MKYDFPVALRDIYTTKTAYESRSVKVPRKKAVIRTDTDQVLSVVSDDYRLIKHEQIFEPFFNVKELVHEKTEMTEDGGAAFVTFDFKDQQETEVEKGDFVRMKLRAFNSYNKHTPAGFELFGYRLVCKNGLTIPQSLSTFSFKHLNNNFDIDFTKIYEVLIKVFSVEKVWKRWAEEKVGEIDILNFYYDFKNILPEDHTEELKQQNLNLYKNQKLTKWKMFNTLSHYTTHRMNSRGCNAIATKRKRSHEILNMFYNYFK